MIFYKIMKKIVFLLCLIMLSTSVFANNLYQKESLSLDLTVDGSFRIRPLSQDAEIEKAEVNLYLFPKQSDRQQLIELQTTANYENDVLNFVWKDHKFETKKFGYTAQIVTKNSPIYVKKKILFPITDNKFKYYTQPTEKIDADNPKIIELASKLSAGEDDLFKVVFNLASWVGDNINYDLNELTTNNAQKASWVLENRQGVCDEMTSLFVAMVRSLGIPARFVSGVSYTEQEEIISALGKNWAGHGWAEVYFPTIGWVEFDITFDELGYIDPTHIKLREKLDPDDPDTKYKWLSNDVEIETKELSTKVNIMNVGNDLPTQITISSKPLSKIIEFGSYNIINVIVKNEGDFYQTATLNINFPKEVEIKGKSKRRILLEPNLEQEVYFVAKIPSTLDPRYDYTFPYIIYTEKNLTSKGQFNVRKIGQKFTEDDLKLLIPDDSLSKKSLIKCNYPKKLNVGEKGEAVCSFDSDKTNFEFCIKGKCSSTKIIKYIMPTQNAGWNSIPVSLKYPGGEERSLIQYIVFDESNLLIDFFSPEQIEYTKKLKLSIGLKKDSFKDPKDIKIILEGAGLKHQWEISKISDIETLSLDVNNPILTKNTKFKVKILWDKDNELEKEFIVKVKPKGMIDRIVMLLNNLQLLVK